ncbi:MAG: DUF2336 domain-containing protein [Proteobacteria bacterium]|nr:DUF2336 domain-containing protein [Pseudomonadota bacterium]
MTSARVQELKSLVDLARDKSKQSRSILVAAINDLYSDEEQLLSDRDRAIMLDIIRRLIHEVETSVRRSLAEHLATRADAPADLIATLANDEIEVAHPILVKSDVLKDPELIEIVQHRTMEHQVAIAVRASISERLSDALVETDNEKVVTTLLSNQGAAISDGTMNHLVEKSTEVSGYQGPLVHRSDLSPELVKKLYWGVSAALRQYIVENFELDPTDIDETIEITVKKALGEKIAGPDRANGMREPDAQADEDDANILMGLLRKGEISMFLDKFTALTRLRLALVRRLLFEPGGEGLAIACKAIGIDKSTFVTIFLRFRQGRLGHKEVEDQELSRSLSFFDETSAVAARAILRRWQRDPDYLNALRLLEQSGRGGKA